ncbi:hypothetical protein CK203_077385 [Vitis vinifera]|uniref:Uncharacterized protein n=1 Tax=Vitis vinifera TaxID=29760 RepID=A0A438D292_VITVI|nr:hypothetical protein CK203_077385 [Vitis vinifera]
MESTADASMLVKLFQRDRVFDFLAGLKPELDEVRSRVLGKEPLPCLSEVYSYVHSEESRRSDVLVPGSQENSTLKVAQDNTPIGPMGHGKKGPKSATQSLEKAPFTKDQLELLYKMMDMLGIPPTHPLSLHNQVTKSLNCHVHCIFQDLATRKKIGSAEEREGFYDLTPKAKKTT